MLFNSRDEDEQTLLTEVAAGRTRFSGLGNSTALGVKYCTTELKAISLFFLIRTPSIPFLQTFDSYAAVEGDNHRQAFEPLSTLFTEHALSHSRHFS